jgi:hypothetical protein
MDSASPTPRSRRRCSPAKYARLLARLDAAEADLCLAANLVRAAVRVPLGPPERGRRVTPLLGLADAELAQLIAVSARLPVERRAAFVQRVAAAL